MRQKGIAATEAAVVCVNSGSLLTVPMNVCERLCRRSFSVTARVVFPRWNSHNIVYETCHFPYF